MNSDDLIPNTSIKMADATAWTHKFQNTYPTMSKAFLIPNAGILSLLQEINVLVPDGAGGLKVNENMAEYGIRAYMGIGPDPETGKDEEKLVLVGTIEVDGVHQDQVEGSQHKLQVPLIGTGAFDLTRPCPRNCDVKSPLM